MNSPNMRIARWLTLAAVFRAVVAHNAPQDKIPEGSVVSADPLDSTLWTHIILQILAWGIGYPTGMVLGIVHSRWHVPVQTASTAVALLAYILGHTHGGRQFRHNIHSSFAPLLMLLLLIQVSLGAALRLSHNTTSTSLGGPSKRTHLRRIAALVHSALGRTLPLFAWTQMLFGGITALGFCHADHLGQCLAHFIMGSAFIAYGSVLAVLLLVGQAWVRASGRSQEFFDSVVIGAWGCVNTFTEHRWGGPWVHNDLQHTSMGVVWWAAGLLGVWLSRGRGGRPKRNLVPSAVIILTGYAMSAHPQSLPLSTMVHAVFGYTLMAAGLARVVEIAFVLRDRDAVGDDGEVNSFQHLPPFLLVASGFLFMGATEEQMALLSDAGVTHVSYILILYSIAFLLYLFVNMLLGLYASYTEQDGPKPELSSSRRPNGTARLNGSTNGHARGHARANLDRRVRDAEEFELEGLISDEDASEASPIKWKRSEESGR